MANIDSLGFDGRLATRRRILPRGLAYGPLCARGRRGRPAANYGDDFGLGEDRDPGIGNNRGSGRFVIPGDIRRREELPSFVTVKGGDYFFIRSLTALRLLAAGRIDPR
jgi:hypothetical protein